MKRIHFVKLLLVAVLATGSFNAWGEAWTKITSTEQLIDGEYLIVYEDGSVVFDGSLTTLDAVSNTQSVTISNSSITLDAEYFFTIAKSGSGYTIKSFSGYYVGQTSDANGLKSSTSTTYTNSISFTEGTATIKSGGAYLRYNATSGQTRFRYFKSSSYIAQKAICLYKKSGSTETTVFQQAGTPAHPDRPPPPYPPPRKRGGGVVIVGFIYHYFKEQWDCRPIGCNTLI